MKIVETLADSLLTLFAPRKAGMAAVQCGEVYAAGLCSGCPPSGCVAGVRQCTICRS